MYLLSGIPGPALLDPALSSCSSLHSQKVASGIQPQGCLLSSLCTSPITNTALWTMRTPKSLQSCPTLCDPMDCSPPGSSVRGILQARILSRLPCPSPGLWTASGPECSPAVDVIHSFVLDWNPQGLFSTSRSLVIAFSDNHPLRCVTHRNERRG